MNWYSWYSWNNSLVAEKIWLVRVQDSMEHFWGTDTGLCAYSGKGVSSQYLVNTQGIHQQCISQQLSESHSGWYGKAQPRWEARCKMCSCSGNVLQRSSKGNWSAKWKGRWAMNHVSLWIVVSRDIRTCSSCYAQRPELHWLHWAGCVQCKAVYSANSRSAKCKGLDEMV